MAEQYSVETASKLLQEECNLGKEEADAIASLAYILEKAKKQGISIDDTSKSILQT